MSTPILSAMNLDHIFQPDKHWEKVYKIHRNTRTHSYVNFAWMLVVLGISAYFYNVRVNVESDVKCIAASVPGDAENNKFLRLSSVEEGQSKVDEL